MKTKLLRYLIAMTILSLFIVPGAAFAESNSPFIGHWEAIDVDGSDIRLTIAGPPNGLFNITWTESYFGFCNREAGVVRGTGWLREGDPNILEADLHLTCFTTGATVDFHVIWIYDPATDTIAYLEPDPVIMTWHRPGKPLPEAWHNIIAHPDEDWVEGWGYPEGTYVSLHIFDPSGMLLFNETQVASYPDWDPNNAWVSFTLGYDLKAGDHLWMTDGKYAKDLIVTNLEITETSLIEQSVSGIAEPGSEIIIEYSPQMFNVTADQEGHWIAAVEGLVPGTPGLASQEDEDGDLTRVVFFVPRLDLRVNYGHDWVESFYEAGHTVGITVTEGDGVTVKATAEMVTEPQDFWGGEAGFQTQPSDWNPGPPDIQPYDWVFAEVDNGQIVQVQIGEINGEIDLEGDGIQGTVLAPWFSSEVNVECHPWGSPEPAEMKFDTVMPDGDDNYSCSWTGEWDIHPEQDVGVGYFGPDGHWVANAFHINPFIWVDPVSEYVNGWNWPVGKNVRVNIYDPLGNLVFAAEQVTGPDYGVGFDVRGAGVDLQAGFSVILSDDFITKELVVSTLQLTSIDVSLRSISGIYDPNPNLGFWINLAGREPESLSFDGENWFATFEELTPGEWGEVAQPDEDGDMTGFSFSIPNPRMVASITENWFYLVEFAPDAQTNYSIYESQGGPQVGGGTTTTDPSGFAWVNFEDHNWDLEPNDYLTVTDGTHTKELVIEGFTFDLFDLSQGLLQGTVPEQEGRLVWVGIGFENDGWSMEVYTDANGNWKANFGTAVPTDYLWVAAQIFDEDGDASELRPDQIVGGQP